MINWDGCCEGKEHVNTRAHSKGAWPSPGVCLWEVRLNLRSEWRTGVNEPKSLWGWAFPEVPELTGGRRKGAWILWTQPQLFISTPLLSSLHRESIEQGTEEDSDGLRARILSHTCLNKSLAVPQPQFPCLENGDTFPCPSSHFAEWERALCIVRLQVINVMQCEFC